MKRFSEWIITVVFSGGLVLLMAAAILLPKEQYSYYENRNLSDFPVINADTILSGQVFDDLEKGKVTHSFLTKKTIDDIVNDNGNHAIDLTGKSGDSQYIPMILQAYDNVLARICRELGINITNVMKRAQVINAEVNGYENYTQIYLTDLLENVREAFDKVNKKWDRNWTVDINDAFKDDNPVSDDNTDSEQIKE